MTRRLIVLTLAWLAAGCQQDPTVPKSADQPVILTLGFSTTTFRIGKADTVTVTITSLLSDAATLYYDTDCQVNVTIRSAAGAAVVPPNGRANCVPLSTSLPLPANGVVTRKFVWNGATNFTPPGSNTFLPAGSYYISATIDALNYYTLAPAVKVDLIAQ